jgi:hypothetical protein
VQLTVVVVIYEDNYTRLSDGDNGALPEMLSIPLYMPYSVCVCVCVTLCYVDGIIYIYGVQNVKCIGPIRATATSFPHTHTETPTVRFRTTRSFPFNDSARFFHSFFYVIVVFVVSSVSLLLPPPTCHPYRIMAFFAV